MMSKINSGVCLLLGVIIFVVLLKRVSSGRYVGDSCTLRRTNADGRCKFFSDCPKAMEDLQSQGIHPQTCGFDGDRPVVCCVDDIFTTNYFPTTIQGSKSNQKCKEYREHYKKNIAILPLPGLHVPIKEECDILEWTFLQTNIARPNEFPHMAVIGYDGEQEEKWWLCSGALISKQFVLTAAHCLTERPHGEPKYIRLGDMTLNSNDDDTGPPQDFNVAGIFKHPEFLPPSFYNDIGLLKMDRAATFYSNVRPACLNTNPNLPDKKFIVSGWGKESHTSDVSSPLLKQTLHYLSPADCENSFRNVTSARRRLKHGIMDETQLCAVSHGMVEIGTSVLQVYNREEYCMYTIVGITSFGRSFGNADVPDVFTKVSASYQWMEGIIWPS